MKTRGLRSNSRPHRFANIDRRTAEGRLFDKFRAELVAHVGGHPNVVQSEMIDRCAWVRLRIGLMDEKMLAGGMTDQDSNVYLAWSNTLRRLLTSLGVQPPSAPQPTLEQVMADIGRFGARSGDGNRRANESAKYQRDPIASIADCTRNPRNYYDYRGRTFGRSVD
jgi:hypothetical protein